MMKFLEKISPELPLRLGLGFMYLYSSYDIFFNTPLWKTYIPPWLFHIITPLMSLDLFLKLQAGGEFLIAAILLAWFAKPQWIGVVALFSAAEMAFILVFVGIDRITFRDIGLLGAALGLTIISFQKNWETRHEDTNQKEESLST